MPALSKANQNAPRSRRMMLTIFSVVLAVTAGAALYHLQSQSSRIDLSTSLSKLQELANAGSVNPDVYYYLGLKFKQTGDVENARNAFAHAASLTDKDDVYVAWASCTSDTEALTILTSYLAGHPQSFAGHLALAQLFAQRDDQAHCNEEAFKAVKIKQDSHDAWQLYGDSSLATANFQAAVDAYGKAMNLAPHIVHDSAGLAAALGELGQTAKALQILDDATKFAPQDATSWIALGKLELDSAKTEDDLAKSQAHLERGTALAPTLSPGKLILAQCLIRRSKWSEAVSALLQAKHALPDDPSLYFLLAQAYRQLNKPAQEKDALTRHDKLTQFEADRTALQLQAGTGSATNLPLKIARLASRAGAYHTAIPLYKAALSQAPGDGDIRRALAEAEQRAKDDGL